MQQNKEEMLGFDIHDNGDSSIFIAKLMAEHAWSERFTRSAVDEYKKFIYLLSISQQRLSPSKVVDSVWHCHLTFTQSYWHELCLDTLA